MLGSTTQFIMFNYVYKKKKWMGLKKSLKYFGKHFGETLVDKPI